MGWNEAGEKTGGGEIEGLVSGGRVGMPLDRFLISGVQPSHNGKSLGGGTTGQLCSTLTTLLDLLALDINIATWSYVQYSIGHSRRVCH